LRPCGSRETTKIAGRGPRAVGGGEDDIDRVFGPDHGLEVADQLESALPEVGIGAEALLGAQLFVGRPNSLGTDEDHEALAHVVAPDELVAEDGVGHEAVHGRDELVARVVDIRGVGVGAVEADEVGRLAAVRVLVRLVEEILAVVGQEVLAQDAIGQ
jgi:hypothetical protein